MLSDFLAGKGFTYCIMALYTLRGGSYAFASEWGRALYWACALGITVSAEFLITKGK